jgi:DNA-binding beta-propeller fold protein YncE
MKNIIIFFSLISFLTVNSVILSQTSEYKIENKFQIEGDGGWDYITADDVSGRLYISHGTTVNVVYASNGDLIGSIPDTKGVHGIAIATDLNQGFISCGRDTSVIIFNLQTLEFITKIKVTGQNPDAILFDKFTHKIFTFNGRSSNATVIDGYSNNVVTTIVLGGKPEFAVADGKGKVYVNIEDKNMITKINSVTLMVEKSWSISPGDEPTGLAMDRENNLLFSVCGNKLMVVSDAETGQVITTLPIGEGSDGVVFDPVLKRAYSANGGSGTITVVQENSKDKFEVIETINTQKGARTIAISRKTHHLYLPAAEYDPAPEPTAENPKPRPLIRPGTFVILDIGYSK